MLEYLIHIQILIKAIKSHMLVWHKNNFKALRLLEYV